MTKIAINGFGRIGRAVFRAIYNEGIDLKVVAINDLTSPEILAHLLRYDSVYGRFEKKVRVEKGSFLIDGEEIKVLSESDPEKLPWKRFGVEIALECTGVFTREEDAKRHLKAGAELAIISANSKTETVPHFVLGINERGFDPKRHKVSAMCSCTTNCAVPVIYALHKNFTVLKSHMLTVHAVTGSQNLVDGPHKDLRRARSALVNTIPTTTGAAKAVTRVLPELEGRISGSAIRAPVICGSVLEVVASLEKEVPAEKINETFEEAAKGELGGTLGVSSEPLVSTDIIGTTEGAIVDLSTTKALDLPKIKDENLVKVIAWYDNEYAYSARLAKFAEYVGKKIKL